MCDLWQGFFLHTLVNMYLKATTETLQMHYKDIERRTFKMEVFNSSLKCNVSCHFEVPLSNLCSAFLMNLA